MYEYVDCSRSFWITRGLPWILDISSSILGSETFKNSGVRVPLTLSMWKNESNFAGRKQKRWRTFCLPETSLVTCYSHWSYLLDTGPQVSHNGRSEERGNKSLEMSKDQSSSNCVVELRFMDKFEAITEAVQAFLPPVFARGEVVVVHQHNDVEIGGQYFTNRWVCTEHRGHKIAMQMFDEQLCKSLQSFIWHVMLYWMINFHLVKATEA